MTGQYSPLERARQDVARRALAAEGEEQWQERAVLGRLAVVADMVCRIGDHPESTHYRAEKAGALVEAALRVELECVNAYLGDGCDETAEDLAQACRAVEMVTEAVRSAMWSWAAVDSAAALDDDAVRDLRRAAGAFSRWANRVADRAVAASALALPEPADGDGRPTGLGGEATVDGAGAEPW